MITQTPLIFSIQKFEYLRKEIVSFTNWDEGEVEFKKFPDGERYQRIKTSVTGRNVILIGGTTSDSCTLEFYDQACAFVKLGAHTLTLVVPYFGYSTMERAVNDGEIVTAKTRARLISSIPQAAGGNRVVFLDLHSEGIPHYLEGRIVAKHLYAKPVILSTCKEIGGEDYILACTDAGRAKWVESLANDAGVSAAFVFKRRIDGETTEITAMNANVAGKNVIIYDDMIRTGGSLIQAAEAYKKAGAAHVSAIATHGLFPGAALERIRNSGWFEQLVVTNSHPRVLEFAQDDFLSVKSIAPIFAEYLHQIYS